MSIMILFLGLTVLCIISTTLQIYICLAGDHDDTEPCGQFYTSENFLDDQAASTQVEGSFPNHTWWQNGSSRGRYNAETVVYRTASTKAARLCAANWNLFKHDIEKGWKRHLLSSPISARIFLFHCNRRVLQLDIHSE
ncbi:hypothetical protein BD769DRAFT_560196 [Suillus cothurnatus]|nr:hypothetical protein BD769DRAFT_560196 [Suillus cothurnatus]